MKRLFSILFAVAMMTLTATAQTSNDSEPGFHPSVEAGASLQYTRDFAHAKSNFGMEFRAVFPLTDVVSFRALANVNGFLPDGFDRDGAALVGIAAGYKMVYGFADFGFSLNPSSRQRINPDVDCGAGLRYDLSELHHLFAEIGTDFTPTGRNDWHTYLFVKIGYTYSIKL